MKKVWVPLDKLVSRSSRLKSCPRCGGRVTCVGNYGFDSGDPLPKSAFYPRCHKCGAVFIYFKLFKGFWIRKGSQ